MFYMYFEPDTGTCTGCTNYLRDDGSSYIEISAEIQNKIATHQKNLNDFVVIKTLQNYMLVERKDDNEIDVDKSTNTLEKDTFQKDAINIVQNLTYGTWCMEIDQTNQQAVYQIQSQRKNKILYVVDKNDTNILLDTIKINYMELLENGKQDVLEYDEQVAKTSDVSLVCFRSDEKYIHVQKGTR